MEKKKKHNRKATKSSSFGTRGRISHNSSDFYNSKLYHQININSNIPYRENTIPEDYINQILNKSSENMKEIPDESIHLIITSPPYNVGKDYDKDYTLEDYRKFLINVFKESYRILVPGGRICINIANIGRKPYIPLHAYLIIDLLKIGFLMRGEIIWNKGASALNSTAWGTWLKATNPVLRDIHEYILIFCKDTFTRKNPKKRKSTITKEEFLTNTKSIWEIPAEKAKKIGHPAPFPVALPYRLIQLYTFEEEIILDPFVGSGTTCIAALQSNRKFIGYESNRKYYLLAKNRIKEFLKSLNT
ncbi:MAG: methyltransferase [Leptospiraceae bacterium]|nr:MAG: methyltransferase [Leptospiraceae bacterium]